MEEYEYEATPIDYDYLEQKCERCNGTGQIYDEDTLVTCPDCHGTGIENEE